MFDLDSLDRAKRDRVEGLGWTALKTRYVLRDLMKFDKFRAVVDPVAQKRLKTQSRPVIYRWKTRRKMAACSRGGQIRNWVSRSPALHSRFPVRILSRRFQPRWFCASIGTRLPVSSGRGTGDGIKSERAALGPWASIAGEARRGEAIRSTFLREPRGEKTEHPRGWPRYQVKSLSPRENHEKRTNERSLFT